MYQPQPPYQPTSVGGAYNPQVMMPPPQAMHPQYDPQMMMVPPGMAAPMARITTANIVQGDPEREQRDVMIAVIIFIVGWFFFPCWAVMLCFPGLKTPSMAAKVLVIVGFVLFIIELISYVIMIVCIVFYVIVYIFIIVWVMMMSNM